MRLLRLIVSAVLAGSFGSCSLPQGRLTTEPVGPENPRGSVSRGFGQLQVFSETEERNSGGILYHLHTPYWVYDPQGKRVESVLNHVGDTDQSPMTVTLAAGEYRVIARAERYGLATIPTIIEGNRLTQIFLEGAGMPKLSPDDEPKVVRLPGGPAIGWKAPRP